MTSTSSLGSTVDHAAVRPDRDIDAAARDVQAAINAARGQLPAEPAEQPEYRKVNPADAPIMILALTSDTLPLGRDLRRRRRRSCSRSSRRSRASARSIVGGGAQPAVRVAASIPTLLNQLGLGLEDVRAALERGQRQPAQGRARRRRRSRGRSAANDQLFDGRRVPAADRRLPQRRRRSASATSPSVDDSVEDIRDGGLANGKPRGAADRLPPARREHHRDRRPRHGAAAAAARVDPAGDRASTSSLDRTTTIRASVRDVELTLADLGRPGRCWSCSCSCAACAPR